MARVEQGYNEAASRINATKIWTFVKVAAVTGKREVVRIIGTAVLLGHNMFDVVGQGGVALVQPAVFATGSSTLPYQLARGCIHSLAAMYLD